MLQELFQDFAAKYVLAAHGTFITARRLHDDAADLKKQPLLLFTKFRASGHVPVGNLMLEGEWV